MTQELPLQTCLKIDANPNPRSIETIIAIDSFSIIFINILLVYYTKEIFFLSLDF
jgi:hypothetical protein